jgi:two-component system, cell cycle sensor histidine kinase and response regulator CckA
VSQGARTFLMSARGLSVASQQLTGTEQLMDRSLRILHLEDEPDYCGLVKALLEKEGLATDIVLAEDMKGFIAALEKGGFDIILADYRLPSCTGIDALREARQRCPGTPFLIVSGTIGEQAAIEAMKCGATDYVLKQWPERLGPAVRRAVREAESQHARRHAEGELNRRDSYLRALTENSLDVLSILSRDGVFQYNSPSLKQVLGYDPNELAGRNAFLFVHPEDLASARRSLQQGLQDPGLRVTQELRFRRRDGSWCHVEVVGQNRLDDPQIAGVVLNTRDITQRKALEQAQRRLATAVEQAAETIVIADIKGTILYVNPAFEKITGYSPQEALGQNPRILKSGRQDLRFYTEMWNTLVKGDVWHGHFINKRKDGTLYEEDASITPIRDAGGQVVNYVAVKRDVSREVQLEAQLRQAQKLEAVGQLAGGVAHDFNNMLAVIRGHAELLLMDEEQLGAGAREGLKHVIRAAEHAAKLTRQLLIFSRKQMLQSQPVALNDLIGNMTKMLNRVVREDIRLECRYAAQLPLIQADPGMLEQVLLNLVVNARDAMPNGGQLLITTEGTSVAEACAQANREARAGEYVCLTVSDTGTGIAPEHLPRMFEPFFTTKEVGKGTGLGLATVYGIVKQHQGWIEVSSRFGEGATFKIFLPAIPAPVEKPAEAQVEARLRGGTETILLVEDEEAVRRITRRVLERYGYTVCEACTAREAREIWRSRREEVALLLTDIIMPEGITGQDLAEELRKDRPGLKVVFMSGYSAEVVGKDTTFFHRTRSHFLPKPCSPAKLLQTVRQCLDEK